MNQTEMFMKPCVKKKKEGVVEPKHHVYLNTG